MGSGIDGDSESRNSILHRGPGSTCEGYTKATAARGECAPERLSALPAPRRHALGFQFRQCMLQTLCIKGELVGSELLIQALRLIPIVQGQFAPRLHIL